MNAPGWAEIALTIGLTVALGWPLGVYLGARLAGGRTWLDPVLRPVERLVYAGLRRRAADQGQTWSAYALELARLPRRRLRGALPDPALPGPAAAEPAGLRRPRRPTWRSTRRSASSPTPTGSPMAARRPSRPSRQMAGLTVAELPVGRRGHRRWPRRVARAFAANRGERPRQLLGRSDADHALRPAAGLAGHRAGLRRAGRAADARRARAAHTRWRARKQTIALGPDRQPGRHQAARHQRRRHLQRQLGPPLREPERDHQPASRSSRCNVLGCACVVAFGRMVLARQEPAPWSPSWRLLRRWRRSAAIYCRRDPGHAGARAAGVDADAGNMEGKEVRFGAPSTAVWAADDHRRLRRRASTACTTASCRSAAACAMFMIQLGEILPGGVGSGLYGMMVMAPASRCSWPA